MVTIRKITFCLLLLLPGVCFSQPIHDFGTWWGVGIRKTFARDFKASLRAEVRLDENSTMVKNFYLAPSLDYSPLKWLTLTAGYRFDNRNQQSERYFTQRHRINFDVAFLYNIKRWDLKYRTRFQMHWEDYYDNDFEYPVMFNRNQVEVAFKWPQLPFKTSISGEIWLPLVTNTELSKLRIVVAQEYRLKVRNIFQVRFIYQTDLSTPDPLMGYILSARYIYSF